ncbi:XrtA-associated tyrosine autokinase [Neptunicella marina]|uniref:non-specific protein-tyrosine kinase n=1 Tax=Neptunicella marina TaxID=2125989 RepID=A0A8J6IS32_9ALTE|nr:XrtA-associated tyrosine autokinase [Neptunicella marina]MBC3765751.1 AAA family ATPase [Neptunicella marina]
MSTIERALQRQKAAQNKQEETNKEPQTDVDVTQTEHASSSSTSEPSIPQSENINSNLMLNLELDEKYFVTANSIKSLIGEEFRAIKRKVLNTAFGPLSKTLNNSNIIMVSSANPHEGKTFTAVNLALSIALEQDKTVLLVDADVLRPNVMRTLGVSYENGLMEYLLGEVSDISEVMYHTNIDKLRIIPAGKSHHLSTEMLASEKMLETVNEFATRYSDRVVIFDSPPLLGINETAIMTNLAGQAVVVIEEGKTKLADLTNAIEQLNPEMAKGFVVNKSSKGNFGHGYGYNYGYGYYGAERD